MKNDKEENTVIVSLDDNLILFIVHQLQAARCGLSRTMSVFVLLVALAIASAHSQSPG